jgi:preprotein translocase subunit YajC
MESLLLPLIILLPLLLLIMRQRKQQREFLAQQDRVAVGQQVMTTAGLFGTVTAVEGDQMVLEIAPGVSVRWAKAAVGRIVSDGGAVADGASGSASTAHGTGDRTADGTAGGPDLTKRDPA